MLQTISISCSMEEIHLPGSCYLLFPGPIKSKIMAGFGHGWGHLWWEFREILCSCMTEDDKNRLLKIEDKVKSSVTFDNKEYQ